MKRLWVVLGLLLLLVPGRAAANFYFQGINVPPTDTPTATATATPVPTSTPTATQTATATPVPTSTQTATQTFTPTQTATNTPGPTSTQTATQTATQTPTQTATQTATPPATQTATPTSTATPNAQTPLPTSTPLPTPVPIPGICVGGSSPDTCLNGVCTLPCSAGPKLFQIAPANSRRIEILVCNQDLSSKLYVVVGIPTTGPITPNSGIPVGPSTCVDLGVFPDTGGTQQTVTQPIGVITDGPTVCCSYMEKGG